MLPTLPTLPTFASNAAMCCQKLCFQLHARAVSLAWSVLNQKFLTRPVLHQWLGQAHGAFRQSPSISLSEAV